MSYFHFKSNAIELLRSDQTSEISIQPSHLLIDRQSLSMEAHQQH